MRFLVEGRTQKGSFCTALCADSLQRSTHHIQDRHLSSRQLTHCFGPPSRTIIQKHHLSSLGRRAKTVQGHGPCLLLAAIMKCAARLSGCIPAVTAGSRHRQRRLLAAPLGPHEGEIDRMSSATRGTVSHLKIILSSSHFTIHGVLFSNGSQF